MLSPTEKLLAGLRFCAARANGLTLLMLKLLPATRQVPLKLMPSCFSASRFTSATVTFSITWSRARTVSELKTLPVTTWPALLWMLTLFWPPPPDAEGGPTKVNPRKPFAMSTAFCASSAVSTEPVRITEVSLIEVATISLVGIASFSVRCRMPMSRPTLISTAAICRLSASVM